ncbi:esterase-like activity of phytase family protein [Micromonospora sp. Llam7]|uniref:esterase-like activity of phytase family protein n=1 Tax=Micromonospora tarapacensis TaxID=2835305 RepID=UPI001C836D1B|nr:esterase-like activity of phytase family protein [Micromonospora tarapacensis]MBX7264607.1 esterase-like activity of phytase family protein [Micromonospora tarapacensis]
MREISTRRLGRALAGAGVLVHVLTLGGTASFAGGPKVGTPTLTGFAALPAATFVAGSEPSGSLVTGNTNGYSTPFADQPIQGFSGIADNGDGTFDVLSDNGYGNIANSADFLLRIHRLAPVFATGTVDVLGGINLTDPGHHVPWELTRPDRVLTGADFDVESIVKAADGTYWIGDEFGPYLLHFDRAGRLLAAPVPLDGVVAPETAARTGVPATLGGSKGFEGLAASPDARRLYAMLEGSVAGDPAGHLRINEFDPRTGAYTGKRYTYRLDAANLAIGDAIAIDRHRFLVIERDGGQGAGAVIKRLYVADKRDRNRDGLLDKTLLVDLMDIANPKRLGGFGSTFTFPFQTIENVVILDDRTVAVLNDNNFPFSTGRAAGVAEDNEWITIRLPASLDPDRRILK